MNHCALAVILCLCLPAVTQASTETPLLILFPTADTPRFTWTEAANKSSPAEPEVTQLPDPDESPQNALIAKSSPATAGNATYDREAWNSYIDRIVVPNLRFALASRLTAPFPREERSSIIPAKASEFAEEPPIVEGVEPHEAFIEIILPLDQQPPDPASPPITMHVQVRFPEETINRILAEARAAALSSEQANGGATLSYHMLQSPAFQQYLADVTRTLKDEVTAQQYFRAAQWTGSIINASYTLFQIVALGTLPLHAMISTIAAALWYGVTAVIDGNPQNLNWKLFSSASNSLLRTTFSDTLIPVP